MVVFCAFALQAVRFDDYEGTEAADAEVDAVTAAAMTGKYTAPRFAGAGHAHVRNVHYAGLHERKQAGLPASLGSVSMSSDDSLMTFKLWSEDLDSIDGATLSLGGDAVPENVRAAAIALKERQVLLEDSDSGWFPSLCQFVQ